MGDRLERVSEEVRKAGLDAIVFNPGPSLTYVTGHSFSGHERLFLVFVPGKGDPVAVVPQLEEGNFRAAVPSIDRVFLWEDQDGPLAAAEAACKALGGLQRLGVEPLGIRFMELSILERYLNGTEITSGEAVVQALRQAKSDDEAASIREAARMAENALRETVDSVRLGQRERAIAAELNSRMLAQGGEGISFPTIVLSGPKSALPHGVPGDREVQAGELLLFDFGTSHNGYHCDITRTFVVGVEPDERTRALYEAVRQGNEAGCQRAVLGASAHDVHTAAQAPLLAPEFAGYYRHRTGHGLGLDVHEPPSIMEGNHEPLVEGSVFTVEPGLYLEGFGGVRIEDDIRVRQQGPQWLTEFPRQLEVIGR